MTNFRRLNNIAGWSVFAISAMVYLMTMEPTASLWDCAEFIATSYKLEVGHPPGAPLFMIIARIFTIFAPSTAQVGAMVNSMSCLISAFTILFMFWSITHFARRIYRCEGKELSGGRIFAVLGAGFVGAMAYTFTDTFWFSAIEGEVYAMSSMFTAMVVWAMLKWEERADEPHSNRWLVLIAYLMGLSIGIHILNLLTIPALVFIYYFRKYPNVTRKGIFWALIISGVILGTINGLIIPYTAATGAWFDRIFVNSFGLPVNSGLLFFVLALFAALAYAVYRTHQKGQGLANIIALCFAVILLGYGSYASVVIRASAKPPMNSNDPSNAYALYSLLNRDQYGNRPLLTGPYYSSPPVDIVTSTSYYMDEDGKYKTKTALVDYEYPREFTFFLPRMYSPRESHIDGYEAWGEVVGRDIVYRDTKITVPTFRENMRYFFNYQLNFMFWRYFLWNFVGRQSDVQSTGGLTDGNWLSGVKAVDTLYLGPQEELPSEMLANKGRNRYFFLPFMLGIIGLIYQLNRDRRNFTVVMWLFFMLGIALVFYFNTTPGEPRERDYVYAGAFYAFSIWIGFGVMWVADMLARLAKKEGVATAVAATVLCCSVPGILAAQNWDDHDRSHRYIVRDMGFNYLETALPNSIVMNFGDNDTFPLWYAQEVEGVRTDVRIMNMSYLGADWYVDEMKLKANDSDAVPFSLPKSKYTGRNDFLEVHDLFDGQPVWIKTVMDLVKSDDPRTQVSINGITNDYMPATVLAIPVNIGNAIANGIVREEEAHLAVDTVYLQIGKSSIDRSELMLLDLLANFDWSRPLYFTQVYSLDWLGMRNYLQFDGYGYRFVPFVTPGRSAIEIGRIDIDYLYDNLMNKFRYGNIADPRTYADYFVQVNHQAAFSRTAYARLAKELVRQRGDTTEAIRVLDRGVELLPFSQIRHSYALTTPLIEAYYFAGGTERGDEILREYANNLTEYLDYYLTFRGNKYEAITPQIDEKVQNLMELHNIALHYERTEVTEELLSYFRSIGME